MARPGALARVVIVTLVAISVVVLLATAGLVRIVHDTVRPVHASLWLRERP